MVTEEESTCKREACTLRYYISTIADNRLMYCTSFNILAVKVEFFMSTTPCLKLTCDQVSLYISLLIDWREGEEGRKEGGRGWEARIVFFVKCTVLYTSPTDMSLYSELLPNLFLKCNRLPPSPLNLLYTSGYKQGSVINVIKILECNPLAAMIQAYIPQPLNE